MGRAHVTKHVRLRAKRQSALRDAVGSLFPSYHVDDAQCALQVVPGWRRASSMLSPTSTIALPFPASSGSTPRASTAEHGLKVVGAPPPPTSALRPILYFNPSPPRRCQAVARGLLPEARRACTAQQPALASVTSWATSSVPSASASAQVASMQVVTLLTKTELARSEESSASHGVAGSQIARDDP